jgi:SAM-dependent methyltransferase
MDKKLPQPTHVPFELESLAAARNYQLWLKDSVLPYLGSRILELGSGIGNLSQHLPKRERLILSDIDPALLTLLRAKIPEVDPVSILQFSPDESIALRLTNERIDTVVSFNVMEHVPDDRALLRDLLEMLRKSPTSGPKRLVSLVPAHQWAFGEIDRRFGHYRRYSSHSFATCLADAGGKVNGATYYSRYLNLPGLMGWWLNGRIRKKSEIGQGSMRVFEALCPVIRPLDDFLHKALNFPAGNSLLTVYRVDRE